MPGNATGIDPFLEIVLSSGVVVDDPASFASRCPAVVVSGLFPSADEVPFEEPSETIFQVSSEVKAHYRWSEDDFFALPFFPDGFIPANRDRVELRTPSPGSSLELSKATVFLEANLPRSIFGRVKIDLVDLYDRNPTSGDRNVDVDEAYLRFGMKYESLEAIHGSHLYALFGKAPKFERQLFRRLESYGLVQTAFNRFNDL